MSRFAYSDAAHLTGSSPLVNAMNRDRLVASWSPHWDLSRPFLLEKFPGNLVKSRFLQALFPEADFIVIVRDPIVTSLAMQKWNPTLVARNGRRRVSLAGTVKHCQGLTGSSEKTLRTCAVFMFCVMSTSLPTQTGNLRSCASFWGSARR